MMDDADRYGEMVEALENIKRVIKTILPCERAPGLSNPQGGNPPVIVSGRGSAG